MDILIGIGVFISTVLLIEGFYLAVRTIRNPERVRVKRGLQALSFEDNITPKAVSIEKQRILSGIDWLNAFLEKVPKIDRIESLWIQSNSRYPLSVYLLSSLLIFSAVLIILNMFIAHNFSLSLLPSAVLGLIPFFILYRKKKKRLAKFENQLPEALDLIARALKAGHAFSTGMRMVASEVGDPLGTEFGRTIDEIGFGLEMDQALKNLLKRVDCADLKFFVMAMILHRDVGGNLAELLSNISSLIRDRFKLLRKVKSLSAQGKMSANVLIGLPFFIAMVLSITAPSYLSILFSDMVGRIMIIMALVMELIGFVVIRKIIDIKV